MAFNGSGTFSRLFSWQTDRNNNVKIVADRHDQEDDGFATGLTNAICKDGQTTATQRIPFASGIGLADGAVGAPVINFTSDTNTGVYRIGADHLGIAANGAKVVDIATTGLSITGTITSTGAIVPSASDGAALGSASIMWADLFLASGAVVNFNNGNVTLTHSSGTLALSGALTTTGAILPSASDGAALGSASVMWSDLFLASGSVVNFNNGDVTVTHSADTLTVAGGALVVPNATADTHALNRITGDGRFGQLGAANTWTLAQAMSSSLHVVSTVQFDSTLLVSNTTQMTVDGADQLRLNRTTSTGTMMIVQNAGSTVGSITQNGTNTAYNTASDVRLKQNTASVRDDESGAIIDALNPSSFEWKYADGNPRCVGFLAHEFLAVIPWGGYAGDTDKKPDEPGFVPSGVDASSVMPFVVAELKYLRARVAALEAQIARP